MHRNKKFTSLLLLALLIIAIPCDAQQQLSGSQIANLNSEQQLLIQGENLYQQPLILVIRIDDRESPGYAERVNLERVIPPGVFKILLPLEGLHTPSTRPLQVNKIRRIIAFQGAGNRGLQIKPLQIITPPKLAEGAIGWDLGTKGSARWPGFTALDLDFPGLHGKQLKAIDRSARKQAADALTSDGIRGIDQLHLPLTKGEWFITLWLRDPGEWEYLPHPLQRSVYANGKRVWANALTASQWIQQVYLAGQQREASQIDNAWSLFGERPMTRISFAVELDDEQLLLSFDGDKADAKFVAAILAEKQSHYPVRDQLEQQREEWWKNNWPIRHWQQVPYQNMRIEAKQKSVIAARDSYTSLEFDLYHGQKTTAPKVEIQAPSHNGVSLKSELRWGQWWVKRSRLSSTLLIPHSDILRSNTIPPGHRDGLPRRLHLNIEIPPTTPEGEYKGQLKITLGEITLQTPLHIKVPSATLPPADRPIGVYLEKPVHFSWFPDTRQQAQQAMTCDLIFLAKQGLTGISPPLSTPNTESKIDEFIQQIAITRDAGFLPPFLAYSPFKRLTNQQGLQNSMTQIAKVEDRLKQAKLPIPIWSIADEPSNPGMGNDVDKTHRYASNFAPQAQLAGQLNHPDDSKFLKAFDVVLLNEGFKLNRKRLDQVRSKGVQPWFYNLANHRAAAGFYLWKSQAKGYLQWHARMPTADPFDPSDGREDDVQLLYPTATPCPQQHDVDAKLFELREGITDLRWILWLEQQAQTYPEAASLLQQLYHQIPDDWGNVERLPQEKLAHWREKIMQLAM